MRASIERFAVTDSAANAAYKIVFSAKFDVCTAAGSTNPASGKAIPVRVVNADAQLVTLDFNHPFAGKELTYWLRLESIG